MYDVVALGELLIDFIQYGESVQSNPLFEANPGGAPCNVLAMLGKLGHKTSFIGKVGDDSFGRFLGETIANCGIGTKGLVYDPDVNTTLALVHLILIYVLRCGEHWKMPGRPSVLMQWIQQVPATPSAPVC